MVSWRCRFILSHVILLWYRASRVRKTDLIDCFPSFRIVSQRARGPGVFFFFLLPLLDRLLLRLLFMFFLRFVPVHFTVVADASMSATPSCLIIDRFKPVKSLSCPVRLRVIAYSDFDVVRFSFSARCYCHFTSEEECWMEPCTPALCILFIDCSPM